MAKTKGPLLSLDAHGSLGKVLTYSSRRSDQQVRKYNKPLATPSAKQRGQRRLTEFLVAQWQNMTAGQKAAWEALAKGSRRNLPGYQYFLSEAQRDLYSYHGLLGYWHFNEIVGGQVLDLSGNSNHGSLQPDFPSNAPRLIGSRSSKFSNALTFDGIDEYIDCGGNTILNIVSDFTVIFWAKAKAFVRGAGYVTKGAYQIDGWYIEQGSSGGDFRFRLSQDGAVRTTNSTNFLVLNSWCQVVVVKKGLVGKIYGNGVNRTSATNDLFIPVPASRHLWIGDQVQGAAEFFGELDEVCIYNRALSAAEIATRYKFSQQKAS